MRILALGAILAFLSLGCGSGGDGGSAEFRQANFCEFCMLPEYELGQCALTCFLRCQDEYDEFDEVTGEGVSCPASRACKRNGCPDCRSGLTCLHMTPPDGGITTRCIEESTERCTLAGDIYRRP